MFGLTNIKISRINDWKTRNRINILRLSLGFVFLWFGVLKFFHGVSPAELIAGRTISQLTLGLITPSLSIPILAVWECTIGLSLILGNWMRLTLVLLYFEMAGTFLPLLLFPHETFSGSIFVPTLLGQYIIKNCVLISGAIVLGADLQGSAKIEAPQVLAESQIPSSIPDPEIFDESYSQM
jgi:uncharacterized membrane protein YphA (DoxX/SURF4 family)